MYNFEPYQGTAGGRGEISQLGMAGDVVMRLCEDIQDKNHKVFFDNFFCTIPLFRRWKTKGSIPLALAETTGSMEHKRSSKVRF